MSSLNNNPESEGLREPEEEGGEGGGPKSGGSPTG